MIAGTKKQFSKDKRGIVSCVLTTPKNNYNTAVELPSLPTHCCTLLRSAGSGAMMHPTILCALIVGIHASATLAFAPAGAFGVATSSQGRSFFNGYARTAVLCLNFSM